MPGILALVLLAIVAVVVLSFAVHLLPWLLAAAAILALVKFWPGTGLPVRAARASQIAAPAAQLTCLISRCGHDRGRCLTPAASRSTTSAIRAARRSGLRVVASI